MLVPLDGSSLAEAVLPLVERLAAAPEATVVLLHILERSAPSTVHGDRHLTTLDQAESYLGETAARLEALGARTRTHAHEAPEGDVARSIVDHAHEEQADLIVLCTHGRGRVRELISGSIAQQVLRRGATPVLLARIESGRSPLPFQPRIILVPLDGTRDAEVALGPARDFARLLSAALHLVMVVPTVGTVRGDKAPTAPWMPRTTEAVLDLEERAAAAYLEGLAAETRGIGITVSTEIRRGDISSALVEETREPDTGLVVIATHGRSGLQAIWAGSVTARVLAQTRAPVLLLRTVDA
ncbi:MAG TPA: universal stress protein [Chloroflexota bacterium]|nr:universal stress protein [Chloroflexota bacterium]